MARYRCRHLLLGVMFVFTVLVSIHTYTSTDFGARNFAIDAAVHNYRDPLEHSYFTLRKDRVNPVEGTFRIDGRNICNGMSATSVIVLIPSVITDGKARDILRSTWVGALTQNQWPRESLNYEFRVAFIFGNGKNHTENVDLTAENKVYNDIVQGSFVDSYYNLTRKTLFGLNWVTQHCNMAKYVIKVDTDTFVHVPKLLKKIEYYSDGPKGKIFGRLWENEAPHREGKWQANTNAYPLSLYPTYCDGPIYVISGSAVAGLVNASEHMPYLQLEDVFVTGIIARIQGINRINILQNVNFRDTPERECSFRLHEDYLPVHITDSGYSPDQIQTIWRCLKDGPSLQDYTIYYFRYICIIVPCLLLLIVVMILKLQQGK